MSHLILVRHGQSVWNLEKRFTGWVDVELTPQGKLEACKAGELIKNLKLNLDHFFCSYQKRAIETLSLILNTLRIKNDNVTKAWQLNERNYGILTGLNKEEMKKTLGEKKVHEFRRSWNIAPEPLDKNNPYHPLNIEAHGNSIRSLCKYIFEIDDSKISKLEIPTGNPLALNFENKKLVNAKYLDKERAKDLLVF